MSNISRHIDGSGTTKAAMKKLIYCYYIFALFFGLPSALIHAAQLQKVVISIGDPQDDLAQLQKAIDKGGNVLLRGTFNLGLDGSLVITKDIEIHGEINAKGEPVTKIKGGLWAFQSPLPTHLPPTAPGPKITIHDIHFEGATWAPISLSYCGGADIRNNKITKVLPFDNKMPYYGKKGVHRQQGIIFYPPYTLPKEYGKYLHGLITGDIKIKDNQIDLSNDIPEMTVAQGILVEGTTGANINIMRNRIVNSSRNSIETLDNYQGKNGKGATVIWKNTIISAEKGIALPSPSTPNGIVAGWFIDPNGASDPKRKTNIVVAANQIEIRGQTSVGIIVLSDDAVIASNKILLKGGEKTIGILHFNSHAQIANNGFEGKGLAAMILRPWKNFKGDGNLIFGNDFSSFKASESNIVLKSSSNILIGESGKFIDEGIRNLVFN